MRLSLDRMQRATTSGRETIHGPETQLQTRCRLRAGLAGAGGAPRRLAAPKRGGGLRAVGSYASGHSPRFTTFSLSAAGSK